MDAKIHHKIKKGSIEVDFEVGTVKGKTGATKHGFQLVAKPFKLRVQNKKPTFSQAAKKRKK